MPASAALHWNVDPVLVAFGPFAIRWYGVLFAAAFLVGYAIMVRIYRAEGRPVESLDRLFAFMLVGAILGARLGHVLFYDPDYYVRHPLDILKVWEGGLASHGGAAGIFLALFLATRAAGPPYLWLLDRVAIPTALGGAFIRLGNFFNSEILGTPTSGGWGVVFERVDAVPRHPVQLYEALAYLLVFALLLAVYRLHLKAGRDGLLLGLFLAAVFAARFLLEFVKTPQASYEADFALSVGQLLSLPFVLAGILLVARALRAAPGQAGAGPGARHR